MQQGRQRAIAAEECGNPLEEPAAAILQAAAMAVSDARLSWNPIRRSRQKSAQTSEGAFGCGVAPIALSRSRP